MAICLLSLGACSSVPFEPKDYSRGYSDIRLLMNHRPPTVDDFFNQGPVLFERDQNLEIQLTHQESILVDLFLPKQKKPSPLLVFQHGNHSSKNYHQYQALLAASWGFNAMTVEQPNKGQWLENGKRLKKLVDLLSTWPKFLDSRYNPDKIILVGHSFGGSAIAIAAGMGAPVDGLIFLDPALVHRSVIQSLKKINAPSILLGADEKVFRSRRRHQFYRHVKGPMLEVSIKNATHNDAQFPNMFSWKQAFGLAPTTDEDRQKQFAAAIVAAAFSIAEWDSPSYFLKAAQKSEKLALKRYRQRL
ncbi:alpha/beta fold hydrolase [Pseudobacteriovorax antillogorgiicola]|nr:alpha/beta hydrolase [Pseudobacteriovorax antillogorgiicola]